MNKWLHILLLTLLIAVSGGVSSDAVALQQTDLATAQRKYDDASAKRQRLFQQLETLEDQYQGLVRKIEQLKGQGALGTIGGRIELQNLLTKSKAIADELDGLQARVRAFDNELAGQRSQLVGGLDQRLQQLEGTLASAAPASRGAIVAELNSLRRRRAAYTTPLPSAPNPRDVSSALRLAEDAAHPDELMAAADELQDTEDQLRKRLAAIDGKLSELREARALARRARSFTREEKFFEETDRDRVIARYERVTVTGSPSQNTDTDDSPSEPTVTAAGAGNEAPASADANNDNGAMFGGGTESDSASPQAGRSEETLTDSPGAAPVASGGGSGGDPFETSRETIVIDGGTDPSRAVGSLSGGSTGVDGQIRSLEGEQKRLKNQANGLRKRAQELRKRARDM